MYKTLFQALIYIVSNPHSWKGHYPSHFTDEATEGQRSEAINPPRLHKKMQNWDGTSIWK